MRESKSTILGKYVEVSDVEYCLVISIHSELISRHCPVLNEVLSELYACGTPRYRFDGLRPEVLAFEQMN